MQRPFTRFNQQMQWVFSLLMIFGAFSVSAQEADTCLADAGTISGLQVNVADTVAGIQASQPADLVVPMGYEILYVLTSGEDLTIQDVSQFPYFEVMPEGRYTIHTLVYDPETLDLGIVEIGVTTGFDVNGLLVQGGGDICASLDVHGAQFTFGDFEAPCFADAGTLAPVVDDDNCLSSDDNNATLSATQDIAPAIPEGYQQIFVLTSTDSLVIEGVSTSPEFMVSETGMYTIHSLVYDTATLDLGIVEFGVTTGGDVAALLEQGGGDICASLDVMGASFMVEDCGCEAMAATLSPIVDGDNCLTDTTSAMLSAAVDTDPVVPEGYQQLFVLTATDSLVIQAVSETPGFTVDTTGLFTIHSLVFDPTTLDLGIVEFGVTTGVDVVGLLEQGGGDICASLDVAGAPFDVDTCSACEALAGTLMPVMDDDNCVTDSTAAMLSAMVDTDPVIPTDYQQVFVLTSGEDLVILDVSETPEFSVDTTGIFTIHSLVFDPNTLDLGTVEIGVTTGIDVNGLLIQGGGDICASLDVAGAPFMVAECTDCEAMAGTLTPVMDDDNCVTDSTSANLSADVDMPAVIPDGFQQLYVLTMGEDLVIMDVNGTPEFSVDTTGTFTIHSLVYDTATLDLGIVEFGVTTGVDVNGLLIQGGGDICASLDVAGAPFMVAECTDCEAMAGTLTPVMDDDNCVTDSTSANLSADVDMPAVIPDGFQQLYVLTMGEDLVIMDVNATPDFSVDTTGTFTIHSLVYDPATLDLGIVEFGVTTGVDVNGLLIQGGGDICASLDVAGAPFDVMACDIDTCNVDGGMLSLVSGGVDTTICAGDGTSDAFGVTITDTQGTNFAWVITDEDLNILALPPSPPFDLDGAGPGTSLIWGLSFEDGLTGAEVGANAGDLMGCFDLSNPITVIRNDVAVGSLVAMETCLDQSGKAMLEATVDTEPRVPAGFELIYVLTSGDDLVIEAVNTDPNFTVTDEGIYTIHTLIYDPNTLDLGVVEFGTTTGVDVLGLLTQGGGGACGELDVAGARFVIESCCGGSKGDLDPYPIRCTNEGAVLRAYFDDYPTLPSSLYRVIYVLTKGDDLIIVDAGNARKFTVTDPGIYRIHTLIYDPRTLDLGIIEFGKTSAVTVNSLLLQGGGDICAILDVRGARFDVTGGCVTSHGVSDPGAFPNPTMDRVQIEFNPNLNNKEIRVDLISPTGAVLQSQDFQPGTVRGELDLSNQVQGLYMIRVNYDGVPQEWHRIQKAE